MNKFIDWHFLVQKGMYFDETRNLKDWSLYFSKIIRDSYWNYAVHKTNFSEINRSSLKEIETIFETENRSPCIYVTNRDDKIIKVLSSLYGYNLLFEESFMVYQNQVDCKYQYQNYKVKRVSCDNEIEDFMSVFVSAYGGDKTPEQPYGELDATYYNALLNSFAYDEKFFHFICYEGPQAVSIATLCFTDGKGGIYNVGTDPRFRGGGYGSAVTNACMNQWNLLQGKVLFLQTETGSAVEQWYKSKGFETIFTGRGLIKEL